MYRMKFAVFGATSGTGRAFCSEALTSGHTIVALARDPSKLTLETGAVQVLRGDVLDRGAVEAAELRLEPGIIGIGRGQQVARRRSRALQDRLFAGKPRTLPLVDGQRNACLLRPASNKDRATRSVYDG